MSNTTLFVRGVLCADQDVAEAFRPCGTVTSWRPIKHPADSERTGMGFVSFATEDELHSAMAAAEQVDGIDMFASADLPSPSPRSEEEKKGDGCVKQLPGYE